MEMYHFEYIISGVFFFSIGDDVIPQLKHLVFAEPFGKIEKTLTVAQSHIAHLMKLIISFISKEDIFVIVPTKYQTEENG